MRSLHLAIAAAVLAAGATVATAQDRVARTPSATDQAASADVSQAQAAMDRAAAAQKYVFLFFWKDKNPQTDKAWSVLQPAVANMADSAEVVSIQITDPAEKQIVDKYGVTRAPMPLVLAVAPCGAITKAFTEDIRRKPTPHRICQPLHATVLEGPAEIASWFSPALWTKPTLKTR